MAIKSIFRDEPEQIGDAGQEWQGNGLWKDCATAQLPVFLSENGRPTFHPVITPGLPRVLVTSVPKSGTYLYAEFLARLGLKWTGVHARVDGLTDYRFVDASAQNNLREQVKFTLPWDAITRLTGPGQFLLGHIARELEWDKDLAGDFRIIFSFRNLRDCLVSQMRFFSSTGRHDCMERGWGRLPDSAEKLHGYLQFHGAFFLKERVQPMLAWCQAPDVLSMSYEQLAGDFGSEVQLAKFRAIARHLGCDETPVTPEMVASVLSAKTLTSSGQRSRPKAIWDDQAEEFFRQHGGVEMNQVLGYDQ